MKNKRTTKQARSDARTMWCQLHRQQEGRGVQHKQGFLQKFCAALAEQKFCKNPKGLTLGVQAPRASLAYGNGTNRLTDSQSTKPGFNQQSACNSNSLVIISFVSISGCNRF